MGTPANVNELFSELRRSIAGYENQPQCPRWITSAWPDTTCPPEALNQLTAFRTPVQLYDPYLNIMGADRLVGHGDYAVCLWCSANHESLQETARGVPLTEKGDCQTIAIAVMPLLWRGGSLPGAACLGLLLDAHLQR